MAEDTTYPAPRKPHQSPAPAKAASLPRLGGPPPDAAEASLPRLKTTPAGTVVVTTKSRGLGDE